MTLKYYNNKIFNKEITEKEEIAFKANKTLGELQLNSTYLPIYFNAWLYDNHFDALMALLFVMIKQCNKNKEIDTTIRNEYGDKLATIFDSIQFWKSSNWKNLRESFKGNDILSEACLLEEVRMMIKRIFDDVIVECGDKLVIFIDELDRCRPTFAVDILESVKHYFDDDRIIFVMSVNKSQLIHTISKNYGTGFDSYNYLNKFFDVNIQLPEANTSQYFVDLKIDCSNHFWMSKFASELQKRYNLSLRDTNQYFQKINLILEKYHGKVDGDSWAIMHLLIPIICVFDLKDIAKKKQILEGEGFDDIKDIIMHSENMKRFILNLLGQREKTEENEKAAMEEIEKIYKYAFEQKTHTKWYEGALIIYSDFKSQCIKIMNLI
ncbi:MAG: hypothetical protein IJE43_02960 [Alphaproteobacteria bacterium]|nr:hypothetical protein [Alphaproteobacteria bacterium]MBQ6886275.1 hypothetical protein [Lachnospiraceae bacterium]